MKGEVFINSTHKYFYDDTFENPFRISDSGMDISWEMLDSKTLFTLEEPEPITERRWKWLKDYPDYTHESEYLNDSFASASGYAEDGYYKSEMYRDVKIRIIR